MEKVLLSELKKGEHAVIEKMDTNGELRQRLMDMGFVEGTKIECVRISPAGDPKAYRIRGTVIAIRKEDAEKITVVKSL